MYLNYIVGGQERVCLLDNETMTAAMKGVMRATGDWVMVQNSNLYYLGRKDRLVKRHGQVLHLDALQQVGASFLMPLTWADDLENISLSTKDSKLPGKSKAFISLSNLLAVFCLICSIWLCQAMESLPQVEGGVVGLHKSSRLVAFVVPKIDTRTVSSEHSSTKDSEDSQVSSRALEMEVLQGLSQLVPNHSIPDTVLLVPALPLTNHGTVCFFPVCITNQ